MDIKVRRYIPGDEDKIVNIIHRASLEINIRDYTLEDMKKLCDRVTNEFIIDRSTKFHTYVFLDNDEIIGVGTIGPYWDSKTEAALFNIFILPEYEGKGIGRKIIETLEKDEYYLRSDRIEIPASITGLEFYRHFDYTFRDKGYIVDEKGHYILEKYPKISNNNTDLTQYNMRPYIDNEYHNYKEFIYQVKKNAYKKYVEECWGAWIEEDQRKYYEKFIETVKKDAWIIQLNGKDIGFYNGLDIDENTYEIGNICIMPEYQGKGIGTKVLKDIIEIHKDKDLNIQYFKQNPVGALYERLGFIPNGETETHYQMKKEKVKEYSEINKAK